MIAGIALLLTLPSANLVFADSGHREYNYLLGTGVLCTLGIPNACPDISMASNGDTVWVTGSGTFSIHPSSATGTGAFVHKDSSGNVRASGTWTAIKLMSFVSYPTSPGFPAGFSAGKAVMLVHLSVGVDAVLTITCEFGLNPPGQMEGIRLNVQDIINFNTHVSGITVFIRTA